MNIKFKYLYRDGANYKNYNEIVFANKHNLPIDRIKEKIISHLISGEFFSSNQFNVPDLHFEKWDNKIDHPWHEFIDIEETDARSNEEDIYDLLTRLKIDN